MQALRGIALELCGGELVVLPGPSGSGKSAFLNILATASWTASQPSDRVIDGVKLAGRNQHAG